MFVEPQTPGVVSLFQVACRAGSFGRTIQWVHFLVPAHDTVDGITKADHVGCCVGDAPSRSQSIAMQIANRGLGHIGFVVLVKELVTKSFLPLAFSKIAGNLEPPLYSFTSGFSDVHENHRPIAW